jgi:uncharacterized membrane protein YgcG
MNTYIKIVLIALIVLITGTGFAFEPPKPTAYVVDLAGKLTPDQLAQLNAKLNGLNKTTKNEFAGLIIPTLAGESIDDVANATFKSWKVGKAGLDNGVLVVIAIAERKSRIETGKGVEGDLTDLQSNDILRNVLAPRLKQDDFYGGLSNTFDAISSKIESRSKATVPVARPSGNVSCDVSAVGSHNNTSPIGLFFMVTFSVLVVIWAILKSNKNSRKKQQEHLEFMKEQTERLKETNKQLAIIGRQRIEKANKVDIEKEQMLAEAKLHAEEVKRFNEKSVKLELERKAKEHIATFSKPSKRQFTDHVIKKDGVPIEPAYIAANEIIEESRKRKLQELTNKRDKEDYERNRRNRELVAAEEARLQRQREEDNRRRRDEDDRRRRQEQDDEDNRRRYESSSSSSSSSLFDYGSSSSSSSDSSFGGFGGGDSSGGGSSSDW